MIGFFNNFCSFLTFIRPTPRKFGVRYYLLIITCLNQISLFCVLVKFIQIIVETTTIELCRAVSYSLSTFTRSTYWLTSWVTIDRLLLIIIPTSSFLKNPRFALRISIVTLLIVFTLHVHELLYSTMIEYESSASSICITNFDTSLISIYNRVSTLIHYLVSFFIQVISISFIIVLAACSRAKTLKKNINFTQILKKQLGIHKELYITPMIIILSALPQTILTFSLACTQMTNWQRHLLLISYLFSYTPQILGFILFVIPSSTFKQEFLETQLGKKYFKWLKTRK